MRGRGQGRCGVSRCFDSKSEHAGRVLDGEKGHDQAWGHRVERGPLQHPVSSSARLAKAMVLEALFRDAGSRGGVDAAASKTVSLRFLVIGTWPGPSRAANVHKEKVTDSRPAGCFLSGVFSDSACCPRPENMAPELFEARGAGVAQEFGNLGFGTEMRSLVADCEVQKHNSKQACKQDLRLRWTSHAATSLWEFLVSGVVSSSLGLFCKLLQLT